jgi:hypothetical protein
VFPGGKKETALAAKVTAIGYIIDGTSYVELGDGFISCIPFFIQKRTHCFHRQFPCLACIGFFLNVSNIIK